MELKSMEFFFSLEQERQMIHELSNKSEWTKNNWTVGQILAGKPEISKGNNIKSELFPMCW
jgi:hypothetical protein